MVDRIVTTVVGSSPVPDWYPVLGAALREGVLSTSAFRDAQAIAVRSAIKDQEMAGVQIVSDGELFRRADNRFGPPNAMVSHFAAKIPGFSGENRPRVGFTPVAPDAVVPAPILTRPLNVTPLGLVEELAFLRENTQHRVKIAMTGPHMFARLVWDEYYRNSEMLAMDMARVINTEFRRLDASGCDVIQLDEPLLWFCAGDREWGIRAINACFEGVTATRALHLCQGNYEADPTKHVGVRIFPSEFAAMLPIVLEANVDVVLMALVSLGSVDLDILRDFPREKILAAGVIDVQTHRVETASEVAATIARIVEVSDRSELWVSPDCGLNHLPRDVAAGKLRAMTQGARLVESSLPTAAAIAQEQWG